MATPVSSSPSSGSGRGGLPILIIGILCALVCIVLTLTQIQTNEAAFLHETAALLRPRWETLLQPYDYVTGNLTNEMAKAVVWGWVSELVFLVCAIGWEEAHHAVSSTWKALARTFAFIALFIVGYNIYTDYLYGGTEFWTQIRFALAMSVAVVFFGIVGTRFIEVGMARIKH